MQLKTLLSKIDIAKYCKNAQQRLDFNSTNLIDDIFEKTQKNHHIACWKFHQFSSYSSN